MAAHLKITETQKPEKGDEKKMRTEGQKMIDIESETFTINSGDEVHTVTLRVNGLVVQVSVQNWTNGHVTPGNITIHELNQGELTIFADKVTKKKDSNNGATWTTIKEASQ